MFHEFHRCLSLFWFFKKLVCFPSLLISVGLALSWLNFFSVISILLWSPFHNFFISDIAIFSLFHRMQFFVLELLFSYILGFLLFPEISYLSIHYKHIFPYIMEHRHMAASKSCLPTPASESFVVVFYWAGHISSSLHMSDNFGLSPGHCEYYVWKTRDFLKEYKELSFGFDLIGF